MHAINHIKPTVLYSKVIAGGSGGVPIHCSAQAQPHYDAIKSLALNGHHWAQLAISGINALASGKLKKQVFVEKENNLRNGQNIFYAVLPGIQATFEHKTNGSYHLVSLIPDKNYIEMMGVGKKPGLYNVHKPGNTWIARYIENGEIPKVEDRFVVITDRNDGDIDDVAEIASLSLSDAPAASSERVLKKKGFTMHFTPGNKMISGLRSINVGTESDEDRELHQSAIQLADTMYKAKDIDGVLWLSEKGGSGVLHKAMEILAKRDMTLEKHAFFLNRPTTPPSKLFKLCNDLGLETEGRGIIKGFSKGEFFGRMSIIDTPKSKLFRLKHDKNYDGYKLTGDIVRGVNEVGSSSIGGAVGAGLVFGIIGSMNTLFQKAFPNTYKKMTNRF